jgi:hypothetical protein
MLMLGLATSWQGRGALMVLLMTNITNLQAKQYTYTDYLSLSLLQSRWWQSG